MTDHRLYSFRRCSFAMRARLALAVSGLRHELREVRLSDKPAELLAMSPKGTVLVTAEGVIIEESLAIMVSIRGTPRGGSAFLQEVRAALVE